MADDAKTTAITLIAPEGNDEESKKHAAELLATYETSVVKSDDENVQDAATRSWAEAIQRRIAEIDETLENLVNQVLHAPEVQSLEASWRGLHYLVKNTETGTDLKLRLLNVSKKELADDLEKAVDKDMSQLFKKVYEEEYGTFGGNPYGLLVGDFYFGDSHRDVALLAKISEVAAAAHAPFVAGTSPSLFNMRGFDELGTPRDLAKIFEIKDALRIKWSELRASEDSRYVALTLPRVLLREPYGPDTDPVPVYGVVEDVWKRPQTNGSGEETEAAGNGAAEGPLPADDSKFLWGNPAWFLAQRVTSAFARYGWTAAIRGVEGGGLVEDLPIFTFDTQEGDKALKGPIESVITDRRERELDRLGFIGLCPKKGSSQAAFFGGATMQRPLKYDTDEANANAKLSSMLPYLLASSRFAHYLKSIMRDKVGSFLTADNVSRYLNRWIGNYVLARDDAGQDLKAEYPLRDARVDVVEDPASPGSYRATVFLRPHFQLEELTTSIRLVAELPPPAA